MVNSIEMMFSYILSTQDRAQALHGLRQLMVVLYEDAFELSVFAHKLFAKDFGEWLTGYLGVGSDRTILKSRVEDVITSLERAPVCVCEIPRQMRSNYYDGYVRKLRELSACPTLLVELKIQPSLLGGTRFTYNGLSYDFSLLGGFLREWQSGAQGKVG